MSKCPECKFPLDPTSPDECVRCAWTRRKRGDKRSFHNQRCRWRTGDRQCALDATIFENHVTPGLCEWHYRKQTAADAQNEDYFNDYWEHLRNNYPDHPWFKIGKGPIWKRSQGWWAAAEPEERPDPRVEFTKKQRERKLAEFRRKMAKLGAA